MSLVLNVFVVLIVHSSLAIESSIQCHRNELSCTDLGHMYVLDCCRYASYCSDEGVWGTLYSQSDPENGQYVVGVRLDLLK